MRISDLSLDVCSSDLLTCCAARIAFGRASLIWSCPTRLSHLRLPIHQPTQRQIVQKPLAEARPFRSKTEKICGQQQCSDAAVFETENCRSASDQRQCGATLHESLGIDCYAYTGACRRPGGRLSGPERKSTRLSSSH